MAEGRLGERSIFSIDTEPCQDYMPGLPPSASILAGEWADDYLSGGLDSFLAVMWADPDFFTKAVCHMAEFLEGRITSSFDPHSFLDRTLLRLSEETKPSLPRRLSEFLDVTVQGLYNLGGNRFSIDLTAFPEVRYIASYLQGEEGRQLEASYSGNIESRFGSYTRHVDLSLEGQARHVGTSSKYSTFTTGGKAYRAGELSSHGEYHLTRLPAILPGIGEHNSFYVERLPRWGVSAKLMFDLKDAFFFGRKNALFFPDGEGGWAEVVQ